MELQNATCTVQLRNIVYIHNQLANNGEKFIFIKGFESHGKKKDGILDMDDNPASGSDSENSEGSAASVGSDDVEMDPLKIIMNGLGNSNIILQVFGKVFISQTTLNKSMNFLIKI